MDAPPVFGVLTVGAIEVAFPAAVLQEVVAWPERFVPQIEAPGSVLGAFNLRGLPVPTVDLRRLLAGADAPAGGGRIAVVQTSRGLLGLAADDIADVVRPQTGALHRLEAGAHLPLVTSLLVEQGGRRVIQVLDVETLASRPGVLKLTLDRAAPRGGQTHRERRQFLFFDCDGLHLCIDVAAAREVIDRPVIEHDRSMDGVFPGVLQLRGRAVPVHDLRRVLALAGPDDANSTVLVVEVRGQMAALLISDVVAIRRLPAENVLPLPGFGLRRPEMFAGVVAAETTGDDAILLSHEALIRDTNVTALQRLHDEVARVRQDGQPEAPSGPRTAFLTFQACDSYTVPLAQVQEILPMPAEYLPFGSADGLMLGVMKRRGVMVPLISFRRLAGHPEKPADRDTRVLLVRTAGAMFGFVVDATRAVEYVYAGKRLAAGQMPTLDMSGPVHHATSLVLAETTEGQRAVFVLDLVKLSDLMERDARAA